MKLPLELSDDVSDGERWLGGGRIRARKKPFFTGFFLFGVSCDKVFLHFEATKVDGLAEVNILDVLVIGIFGLLLTFMSIIA